MRRRLVGATGHPLPPPPLQPHNDDSEPDSSCSESGPTASTGVGSNQQQQQQQQPQQPNISVGGPMGGALYGGHLGWHSLYPHLAPPPPPHPHAPPLFPLFNAQLAQLAASAHPFFTHYHFTPPHHPPHSIKGGTHRFAPYSLPSAFESVASPLSPPPAPPSPPAPTPSSSTPPPPPPSASELKSIEKMVNGLEVVEPNCSNLPPAPDDK